MPDELVWKTSPSDHQAHAFRLKDIGELTAQAICDHSARSSRLTDEPGRRCLACLLLHGDDLANRHGTGLDWAT